MYKCILRGPHFKNLPSGAHSGTPHPKVMPSAQVVPSQPTPAVLLPTLILIENPKVLSRDVAKEELTCYIYSSKPG